jgi:hypothetical protein
LPGLPLSPTLPHKGEGAQLCARCEASLLSLSNEAPLPSLTF